MSSDPFLTVFPMTQHPSRIDLLELESGQAAALEPALAGARLAAAAPRPQIEPAVSTVEGEITDLIERQPDEVAQTLRSWLADRRT